MSPTGPAAEPVFGGARHDVAVRLDGLTRAVEAARGRVDDEILEPASMLTGRATQRLSLSGEHTIVALAGATGSGKSSLFNSLTDLELAGVGVRRPTTSWALACSWGPDGAEQLLEWMGIPPRHQVSRLSMLDRGPDDTRLDGLVLLDLPDHDSTEVSHHVEMDRLVQHADLLVWVLDPQKYADAAIHDRYIRPMASYSDVTLVLLNQIDRIPPELRRQTLEDLRRILAAEGLPDVTVMGVSAVRGDGIEDLKRELSARIRAKSSARERLGADVSAAAEVIAQVGGTASVAGVADVDLDVLDDALVDCAGVPQVVESIAASTRRRAAAHTGWPVARWLRRLGPAPLADLDLDRELSPESLARTPAAEVAEVQRSQAAYAIREFADKASTGLLRPWRDAVHRAADPADGDIVAELDAEVRTAQVGVSRTPVWWYVVHALQLVLVLGAVAGLAWWAAEGVAAVADLTLPDVPLPDAPAAAPAWLTTAGIIGIGSLVAGLLLGGVASLLARWSGSARARSADRELRDAIEFVAQRRVVDPVTAELAAYGRYREGILSALG